MPEMKASQASSPSQARASESSVLRRIAFIVIIALAVPSFAMAQGYEEHHRGERPPPGEFRGPHPGGPPGHFMYHGRPFNPIHAAPFVYPHGWAYRRWVVGATLPPLFLAPAYYYSGWATLGLLPPQPNGFATDPTFCWSISVAGRS